MCAWRENQRIIVRVYSGNARSNVDLVKYGKLHELVSSGVNCLAFRTVFARLKAT